MSYIQIAIILILVFPVLFFSIERAYQVTLFSTIFTRMAFVNINNNSILVYHILTLILLIRIFFLNKGKLKIRVPAMLIAFALYMGISIFFAIFCGDTFVINVDNKYARVQFSIQQFTQYAYLLFGVIFMAMTSDLLVRGRIRLKTIWSTLDISYVLVIVLGFLQLLVPIGTFDEIFRNSTAGSVLQIINGMHRIDSVFGEPSMMMLFVTPLFCKYGYDIITDGFSRKKLLFLILGGLTVMQNHSSSFLLGLFIAVAIAMFFAMKNTRTIRMKHLISFGILILAVGIFLNIFQANYQEAVNTFFTKIHGKGTSGSDRTAAAFLHFHVFLNHFLFGVGFGTLRSYDLVTGWLAQGGCIGMILYLGALVTLCFNFWKDGTPEAEKMMIVLVSYNAIMMISVPEFNQIHIWVYYAMAQFMISAQQPIKYRQKFLPHNMSWRKSVI